MIFLYVIFAAIGLGDLAWWRWADGKTRGRPVLRTVVGVFVGLQLVYLGYFLVNQKSARRSHPWVPVPFLATVYIWSLIVLPASLVGVGVGKVASLVRRKPKEPEQGPTVSRRKLLSTAAVVVPPLVTGAGVVWAMPQLGEFRVRRLTLAVPGLPPNLDGMTIAQLSDTHVGRYTRPGSLERVVDATNGLRADLVLFTGDLIDLAAADLPRGWEAMRRLDPRHGFAMIEGNHDLIEDADGFDRRTKAAGLPLLVDEAMTVSLRGERVQLLGMRWGAASGDRGRATAADFRHSIDDVLLPRREPGAFPILMAHHPHAFDVAAAAGLPLTLSGHTHGGQMNLTDRLGFGPLFYRYWSGPYRKAASQLVVSNGVGNWFPLRIRAPAEVVHLTLRRET